LAERIITIEGDEESKRDKALELLVRKISEDEQHNSVLLLDSTRKVNPYDNIATSQADDTKVSLKLLLPSSAMSSLMVSGGLLIE
jgi:hypothetical protein